MIPAVVSQLTFGRSGDFMMSVLTILVAVISVSAQIHSLSAIFMYDVYLTYINPFPSPLLVDPASAEEYRTEYLWRNRRNVYIRHGVTVFFSVLTYPAALVYTSVDIAFVYKITFVSMLIGPSVIPVWLSMICYRTTGKGVIIGTLVGLIAGLIAWVSYASSFPGGLASLLVNTGRQEVIVASNAVGFVVGGIACVMVSLLGGGRERGLSKEDKWEACLALDNPVKSWALQYSKKFVGIPGYKEVGVYNSVRASIRVCGLKVSAEELFLVKVIAHVISPVTDKRLPYVPLCVHILNMVMLYGIRS